MNRRYQTIVAVVAACIAIAILPAPALSIPRDVVMSRGNVWVNHVQSVNAKTGAKTYGVPYSQSRWAKEDGSLLATSTKSPSTKGYRTDCSGFVSLCWQLKDSSGNPYSSSTAEMGAKGSKKFFQITKAQLQPGDAILKSTVWGAPVGHVILFCGWADSKQTTFWAMEQTTSSSHNGTIYHTRPYGQDYYRPYRYSGLDDMYADVEETVAGADAFKSAAAAADAAYPGSKTTVPALVIASSTQWADQVTAAAIAGAVRGPMLLTSPTSLPSATSDEIKRLKPKTVFILGSTSAISAAVASKVASMGPAVARINGKNSFVVAAASLSTVVGRCQGTSHAVDTAYIVNGDECNEALSIAPVLDRATRPVLFVHATSVPDIVITKLKAAKVKKLIILGGTGSVSDANSKALVKAGFSVTRIAGADRYKTALAIVNHALALKVGFTWKRMGVASPSSTMDGFAWGSANGVLGSVLALTPSNSLDANVRKAAAAHRTEIGKARVFGGSGDVSQAARKALALALRSGK